ncbi:hypothetical protein ACFQI7_27915 [Paenibacillus allorhizosphaerae]|uniref:Uncharacterized protein n=1 Tax=Paenibacillus allorhizosphaerae TaxID=2849866 RepID=A0ABM8VNN7_9BACL|nr:hypothetical protein [Paenibacillus allorhizosphaerae]CAG7651696.1 hypothetical protein PAECIP111802_05028 [Paenibacillus allorhizosphaerae]
MHESEWLPQLLSKHDLLQICNLFNLSVPGFRSDKLSSRPEEQLRLIVTQALKNGIGAKKNGSGKILTETFFSKIVDEMDDLIQPQWKNLSFESIVDELDISVAIRPYQKLAFIREWFPDKYASHVETIRQNVIEKQELFHSISKINDSDFVDRIIQDLKKDVDFPESNEYLQFIEQIGVTARWEQIKSTLAGKHTDRERLMFISGLTSLDRFLGIIAVKDDYEPLRPVAYSLYVKEREKAYQSEYARVYDESAATMQLATRLTKELEEQTDENTKLTEQIEILTWEIKRLKDAREEDVQREDALQKELGEQRKAREYAEQFKELFEELVPESSEAMIITDKPDPRIKQVFNKCIFSKNFLLKEKLNGNIHNLKSKIWFIDRQSFRSTREWVLLKQFLDENDFFYEEYNDYLELLRRYMQVIQSDDTEDYN